MAKKQHGKSSSPLKKLKCEKMMDNCPSALDSSDDDAPEELTFEESKTAALRSMREALETAKREKELLKEKRRKRQQLFQEQKKRRLLPADILEEIDTAQPKKKKLSGDEDGEEKNKDVGCSDVEQETKEEKKKQGTVRSLKGSYSVMRVKDQPSANSQQMAAADFIASRMYGPGSRRTTSNEFLSLEKKNGHEKGAAVQFVNKQWGAEKKAKAEKLKMRWIHTQKVSSS